MFGKKKKLNKDTENKPYRGKPLTMERIQEALRNPPPPPEPVKIFTPKGGFELDKLNKRADELLRRL